MPVASDFVRGCLDGMTPGRALDVACGTGRHALLLAESGFETWGVDVSGEAISRARAEAARRGLALHLLRRDVVAEGLPAGTYDVVVCTFFLERSLFAGLAAAVAPGGRLLFETYTRAHADRTGFPHRYCLETGELARAFPGLVTVEYREDEDETRAVARLLAQRPPEET